ncbi:MAG: hypothetical protein AAF529_06085 [Pseudomonadota bacterium]
MLRVVALTFMVAGLAAGSWSHAETDDQAGIKVASLAVKERLQSMEQVNVSSEKTDVVAEPQQGSVAEILAAASALEELPEDAEVEAEQP